MKKLIAFLFMAHGALAQGIVGTWNGELTISGMKLPLVFHVDLKEGAYSATMDSPAQNAKGIKMQEVTFQNKEIKIVSEQLGLKYVGQLTNDSTITGEVSQSGIIAPLNMKKGPYVPKEIKRPQEPKGPFLYYTEDVSFKNEIEGNELAGTLAGPTNQKNIPVYVLITGSGSQNRNSEIMGHKPFLVIADYFAKAGIATLRLDDRGVGKSSRGKSGATSYNFATDISAAVDFLAEKGYQNIGLIGHSEGGLIAPMVYDMNKKVKSMILLAGPGMPVTELMKLQTYYVNKTLGLSEEEAQKSAENNYTLYQFVVNYKGNELGKDLNEYLKEVMPNLTNQQRAAYIMQLTTPWMRYFLSQDPDQYLSKIQVPLLALNGSKDIQVPAKENLEGIKKSLAKAQNKNVEVVEFENLNHLFQTAVTGSVAEYGELEETFAPQVLDKMRSWILQQF